MTGALQQNKSSTVRNASAAAGELLLMGVIGKPRGVKGEVWVYSYTQNPADIAAYGSLCDETGREFALSAGIVKEQQVSVRIDGVADRNAVESLRGVKLYAPRTRLPQLEQGRYYLADLIGLTAFDAEQGEVGEIVDVFNCGAGDILEIKQDGKKEPLCLLFHNDFVGAVDLNARRVQVHLPEEIEMQMGEDE